MLWEQIHVHCTQLFKWQATLSFSNRPMHIPFVLYPTCQRPGLHSAWVSMVAECKFMMNMGPSEKNTCLMEKPWLCSYPTFAENVLLLFFSLLWFIFPSFVTSSQFPSVHRSDFVVAHLLRFHVSSCNMYVHFYASYFFNQGSSLFICICSKMQGDYAHFSIDIQSITTVYLCVCSPQHWRLSFFFF